MKKKLMALFLALSMAVSLVTPAIAVEGEDEPAVETCTVTVNFVYASNQAMVAQPYSAQIAKGSSFTKSVDVPSVLNYSAAPDGDLPDGVTYSEEEELLKFDIDAVNEDVEIVLYYTAGTAKYTVYHHYQNLENDEYTKEGPVELTGDIDAYTQATAQNRQGFTCKGVPEYTIAADGTTQVDIYYDRNYYTVVFDVNGGLNGPAPLYGKYGTPIDTDSIEAPTRAGYNFAGWNPEIGTEITSDITYEAQWTPKETNADYTIVIWGQNANDDEYSYLSSHSAFGAPGATATWNEDILICEGFHTHSDNCYRITCGLAEHTHDSCQLICEKKEHTHDSSCCSKEVHNHTKACYSGVGDEVRYIQEFLPSNPPEGYIYESNIPFVGTFYYIYIGGTWYFSTDNGKTKPILTCEIEPHTHDDGTCDYSSCSLEHSHTDDCYGCGQIEHTHSDECKELTCGITNTHTNHTDDCYMKSVHPGKDLWIYERCEEVTINADGSTVLNVYFKRKEFTLTFRNSDGQTIDTIKERWGKNIKSQFDEIETTAKSSLKSNQTLVGWHDSTTGKYTNYVGIMPKTDKVFTAKVGDANATLNTMTYYIQDLQLNDVELFKIQFRGNSYTVTADEYYELKGFSIDTDRSTAIGRSCQDAVFYYTRNEYNLEFYSASNSTPDKKETPLYEENLGSYAYTPTSKPDTVEQDAIFVGWYQNPECTGEAFDLSAHKMPANYIALYAKWVNGLYTVTTYTDESMKTLYTYEGYDGKQENIVKYELADKPQSPTQPGLVFVGWFYQDESGAEQPFSFTMPITRDYNLYPKFSDLVMVNYTVHYYVNGTTEKVADDTTGSALVGSSVTLQAKMGNELNLVPEADQDKYFPTSTSTSVILNEDNQEIIFYYTLAGQMTYTVKYVDPQGNDLRDPVTKTTTYSTVTEQYEPIDNYTPRQYQITQDLTANAADNVITFVYDPSLTSLTISKSGCDQTDAEQSFVFKVTGTYGTETADVNMTVTIQGNGEITIKDLPVGSYTVTEDTSWSWRYTPDMKTKDVTLGAGGSSVEFVNSREKNVWLNANAFVKNLWETITTTE